MFNTIFNDYEQEGSDCRTSITTKLMIVKQSYFIQSCDLINADNGFELSEEDRDEWKKIIASYLENFPSASFEDFMGATTSHMLKQGELRGEAMENAVEFISGLRSNRGY